MRGRIAATGAMLVVLALGSGEALAPRASFEEVVYLLWHDALPDRPQLEAFRANLAAQRQLLPVTRSVLEAAAQQRVPVMDALRMAAGTLAIPAEASSAAD